MKREYTKVSFRGILNPLHIYSTLKGVTSTVQLCLSGVQYVRGNKVGLAWNLLSTNLS